MASKTTGDRLLDTLNLGSKPLSVMGTIQRPSIRVGRRQCTDSLEEHHQIRWLMEVNLSPTTLGATEVHLGACKATNIAKYGPKVTSRTRYRQSSRMVGIRASQAAASASHICVDLRQCTGLEETAIKVKWGDLVTWVGSIRSSNPIFHLKCRSLQVVIRLITTAGSTHSHRSKQLMEMLLHKVAMSAHQPRRHFQHLTTIKCNKGVLFPTRVAATSNKFSKVPTIEASLPTWQTPTCRDHYWRHLTKMICPSCKTSCPPPNWDASWTCTRLVSQERMLSTSRSDLQLPSCASVSLRPRL